MNSSPSEKAGPAERSLAMAMMNFSAKEGAVPCQGGSSPNPAALRAKIAYTCLGLIALSLLLFLPGIGRPPAYVFDEEPYVSSAKALLNHASNPNPEHPPVGKYLIAAGIKLAGDNPAGWRVASAVSGGLTLVAIFLWTFLLLRDYSYAVTAAALTLFNNFLFVMARVALLEIFMFLFLMWALVGFTAAIELDIKVRTRRALLLFSGPMFGLAGACKWNAVVTLAVTIALAFALLCLRSWAASRKNDRLARAAQNLHQAGAPTLILSLALLPVAVYLLAYIPLFRSLDRPFTLPELGRLHAFMWSFLKQVKGNRAIHLPWYAWPFSAAPQRALSYLMGNFVVMWGGLLALAICARRMWQRVALPETFVLALYAANLLQWAIIPRKVTYYYYYYPAAMFLGVAIAVGLCRTHPWRIFGIRLSFFLVAASAIFFLFCYPRMANLEAPWDCMFGCWT